MPTLCRPPPAQLLKGGGLLHKEYTRRKVSLYDNGTLTYWHIATEFRDMHGKLDASKGSMKKGGSGVVLSAKGSDDYDRFEVTISRTDAGGEQKHKVGDEVTWHFKPDPEHPNDLRTDEGTIVSATEVEAVKAWLDVLNTRGPGKAKPYVGFL